MAASDHGSYVVKPWVLYASKDPLRAQHDRAGVDAVIVETPFERVRFQSFLETMQGTPLTASALRHLQQAAAGEYGFIVYSHSRSDVDRGFLTRIGHASIDLADARQLRPVAIERFGPATDFYSVGDFREIRWTGSMTVRFAVDSKCAPSGTFRFTDGYGHVYALPFAFARFR